MRNSLKIMTVFVIALLASNAIGQSNILNETFEVVTVSNTTDFEGVLNSYICQIDGDDLVLFKEGGEVQRVINFKEVVTQFYYFWSEATPLNSSMSMQDNRMTVKDNRGNERVTELLKELECQ